MTARGTAALYTPDILSLAMVLADFPLADDLPLRAEAASKVCGSRIALGLERGPDGRVVRVGARVTACAIGQAAAALFLQSAAGASQGDLETALALIESWLAGGGDALPDWPGIAILDPARAYPARHAAILLPWRAAVAALSKPAVAD